MWGWLVVFPVLSALGQPHAGLIIGVAVAFVGLYAALMFVVARERGRPAQHYLLLALMGALVVTGQLIGAESFAAVWVLFSMAVAVTVPLEAYTLGWVIAVCAAYAGLASYGHVGNWGSSVGGIWASGCVVWMVRKFGGRIASLQRNREELATLAVAQERLRFARDLHDLLGHTLSAITIKAEVVRRIAVVDPQRAAAEGADIERIGREALAEIRAAVSGYRDRGLTDELDGARQVLSAAGIAADIQTSSAPLPQDLDALCAWVVREAVTNVVRHARAAHVSIRVRRDGERVTTTISDDGIGGPLAPGGNGLAGLAERVESVGGVLTVRPGRMHGFEVSASVPVAAEALAAGVPGSAAAPDSELEPPSGKEVSGQDHQVLAGSAGARGTRR